MGYHEYHHGPLLGPQLESPPPREEVPIWKGFKQCAPESPALWNILLGGAIAPAMRQ